MRIEDFDYNLPENLIAQKPADKRDSSRLLVVHRDKTSDGSWADTRLEHRHFYEILEYLSEGDCLVLNDSKVIPARLYGRKAVKEAVDRATSGKQQKNQQGAKAEFLLIKRVGGFAKCGGSEGTSSCTHGGGREGTSDIDRSAELWEVMVRPGRRLKPGDDVLFSGPGSDIPEGPLLKAHILDYGQDGTRIVRFEYDGIFMERLEEIGSMPLPPYIERPSEDTDKERYQTVYCREEGSVAAPTAGLHFTDGLLEAAKAKGVQLAYVTLHVGIGTFRPVKVENIEEHHMHFEEYSISRESADTINRAKREGRRVISVGTTSTRTMESAAYFSEEGCDFDKRTGVCEEACCDSNTKKESNRNGKGVWQVRAGSGSTGIFIYPGYEWKIIDSLITNFHLPKSTLLMLISALYDREKILEVYEEAVREGYRFFSYGDAMFIE